MKKPLVGVVPLVDIGRDSLWMLPGYMDGVAQAGGLPVMLPLTAPEDARVARLAAREGVSEQYARLRIRAQKPDSFFAAHCDHILHNDGSREDFR